MFGRANAAAGLLLLSGLALAQDSSYRITFDSEERRQVWVAESAESGPVSPTEVSGVEVEREFSGDPAGQRLFVHELAEGHVFSTDLSSVIESGSWSPDGDPESVMAVDVRVTSDEEPVSSALVRLIAGGDERIAQIGVDDFGTATFFAVPFGRAEVEVEYRFEGETRTTDTQVFNLEQDREDARPVWNVAISDAVPTSGGGTTEIDAPPTLTEEQPEEATEETSAAAVDPSPRNPLVQTLISLLGIGVVAGLLFAAWKYVKANPEKVEETFERIGIKPPTPDPNDADGAAPAMPKKPEPVQPIVLDDAAPAPTGAVAAATTTTTPNPRLVNDGGDAHLVGEELTVGRDAASGVPLEGEGSVSRNHARLERRGEATVLIDLGSTNGTYVNGVKLSGEIELKSGDQVQFGAVQFRFEV